MDVIPKHRKSRPRLGGFDYRGLYAYSLTLCTATHSKVFTNKQIVSTLTSLLKDTSLKYQFAIHAFCFMPDHLHVLAEGKNEASDLRKFIKAFKQKSGFDFKQLNSRQLWQPSFYDHILRKQETALKVAKYIWNNPRKKELSLKYCYPPYIGSFEYPMDDWM